MTRPKENGRDTAYQLETCPALPPLNPTGEKALRIRVHRLEAEQAARRWYCDWLEAEMARTAHDYIGDQTTLRTMRDLLFLRGRNGTR